MKTSKYDNRTGAKRVTRHPLYQHVRERANAAEERALADRKARLTAEESAKAEKERADALSAKFDSLRARIASAAGASGSFDEVAKRLGIA